MSILASSTAILEPQITLKSVDGDDVIFNASPEWKKKLADFLTYAATTDDAEVDCFVSLDVLDEVKKKISSQIQAKDALVIQKIHLLKIYQAFLALNVLSPGAFYDYPADDFDRLHDDFFSVYEAVFEKDASSFRRIKTGLSGGFYG